MQREILVKLVEYYRHKLLTAHQFCWLIALSNQGLSGYRFNRVIYKMLTSNERPVAA